MAKGIITKKEETDDVKSRQFDGIFNRHSRCNPRKIGGGLINPQDFADKIRALPVRGEVDHEWHIYFDDTKPAALYGGTWEELAQGTFIMAAGNDGRAGQTGGNSSHNHAGGDINNNGLHACFAINTGDRMSAWVVNNFSEWNANVTADYPGWRDTGSPFGYTKAVPIQGFTQESDNIPPYSTAHIWRRVA